MAELLSQTPDPWWITGLVDGEGCFYASARLRVGNQAAYRKGDKGVRYPFMDMCSRFLIRLRADDVETLAKVRQYFGAGRLPHMKASKNKSGKSGSSPNPSFEFRISSLSDIQRVVIPHFDRYPLQSKKRHDYVVWKEIVEWMGVPRPRGWWKSDPIQALAEIESLVSKLRVGRDYDPKVAKEYVEGELHNG